MNPPETGTHVQMLASVTATEMVDWFSPGEGRVMQIGDTSVVIRLVDRKGRRARIAVTATQGDEAGRSSGENGPSDSDE